MKVIKYYCDCCGAELPSSEIKTVDMPINLEMVENKAPDVASEIYFNIEDMPIELCMPCVNKMYNRLIEAITQAIVDFKGGKT